MTKEELAEKLNNISYSEITDLTTTTIRETYTGYDIDKPTVRCKEYYVDNGWNDKDSEAIKEWNTRQSAIDWKPIEELPKRVNVSFIRIVAINTVGEISLYRYGTSESLRQYLIGTYTHFAELTPPKLY